jgi:hypothetical protein
MASTWSDLKIELITTGEQSGTWGDTTNTNLGTALEQAIVGQASVTFASGDVTLTLSNSNALQDARALRLYLTGTTGGSVRNCTVPAIEKPYLVYNNCAEAITVLASGGAGISVPASTAMWLYNDGTNVVDAENHKSVLTLATALAVSSGGTGATSASDARTNLNAAKDGANSDITSLTGLTTPLTVPQGGTGAATHTANSVLVGAGSGVVTSIAPGSSGNVLTSNGTVWQSGAAAAFDTGTRMIFAQNAAPTGWTKDTTNYNQHAMRIVTGTAGGTAGTVDFTSAFTSQAVTGSVSISAVAGSAGATTLSTPQIPSHTHGVTGGAGGNPQYAPGSPNRIQIGFNQVNITANINSTGGGGSHSHPFSFSSGSGTFSGTAINLAVKYLDVITATKD